MNLSELKKISDIEYFEIPMLSLFSDKKGHLYLWNWVDVSENSHLWLVFETSPKDLLNYLNKKIDQQTLINLTNGQNYYLVETTTNNITKISRTITKNDFYSYKELLPDAGFFFKNEFCYDYDEITDFLNQRIQESTQKILFFVKFNILSLVKAKVQNSFNAKTTNLYATQSAY